MIHGRLIDDYFESNHPAAHRFQESVAVPQAVEWTSELWLPEPFEPRYSYPLMVWLHDTGQDELTASDVANEAARQNMIVMSVRGTHTCDDGFGWSNDADPIDGTLVWRAISEELSGLPAELRIHPERIFLAGRGAGAIAAWRAWIGHSDRVAGAALIEPGDIPDSETLRRAAVSAQSQPALSGRLWIGGSAVNSWRTTARTAYALGAEVSLDPTATMAADVGRSLDRWVMRALPTAVFA